LKKVTSSIDIFKGTVETGQRRLNSRPIGAKNRENLYGRPPKNVTLQNPGVQPSRSSLQFFGGEYILVGYLQRQSGLRESKVKKAYREEK